MTLAETPPELELRCRQWRGAFATSAPDKTLRWYFGATGLTQAQIDFEQARILSLFRRSVNRQMRFERERFDRGVARQRAERERQEQARFDQAYQARQQQRVEQAQAEAGLEREARKDDWPKPARERPKKPPAINKRLHPHRNLTVPVDTSPGPSSVECFALPRAVARALDLGRSDLDLLGDLQLTASIGFVSSPHSRRRAYFSRWGRSFAPVTLAGRRVA